MFGVVFPEVYSMKLDVREWVEKNSSVVKCVLEVLV